MQALAPKTFVSVPNKPTLWLCVPRLRVFWILQDSMAAGEVVEPLQAEKVNKKVWNLSD